MLRFLLLLLPFFGLAQIPSYYSSIDFNLTGDALKNELTTLITNTHTTELPYTSSSQTDVWDVLKQTDLDTNNNSLVFLIYGFDDLDAITKNDITRDKDLSCHVSSCTGLWNREHVYAKSLATPSLTTDFPSAGTDAHSLRSCDGQMNSSRSNRPYEGGSGDAGITASGNWYPGDEWKGDVARMMMYMYVRYPSQCLATNVGVGSVSYAPFADMPDIFLEWNNEDPVSAYEMNRNNVLESIQGNRNPFIDNPYIATVIWNGPVATDTWNVLSVEQNNEERISLYPTVTRNYVYVTNNTLEPFEYTITNYLGQIMANGVQNEKIDFTNLSSGMYLVKIELDNKQKVYRVFKN